MRTEKPKLQWTDAWILLAVIRAAVDKRSASSSDVIAEADYLNHAIATREELELCIGKLVAERYVLRRKNGFRPSAKAVRLWKGSPSKEKRALAALQRIQDGIGAAPWEPGPLPATTSEQYVEALAYERALTEYLSRCGGQGRKRGAGVHKR